MPKIHNLGPKHFFQYIDFPVNWEKKLWVKGWTQEIQEPFRYSSPLILRLPFHKAFVVGKWEGVREDEEDALNRAIEGRVLTDEDFQEGWEPPAYEAPEESGWDFDTRPGDLVGEFPLHYWKRSYRMDEDEG